MIELHHTSKINIPAWGGASFVSSPAEPLPARRAAAASPLRSGAVFLLMLAVGCFCFPRLSSAQTIDSLVEYPPLLKIDITGDWRYESEFFLNSTYVAIKSGDYHSADGFAKKLLEQRPDDPKVLQLAIHTSMTLKKWDEAESYLKRQILLQPDNVPARVRLGFVKGKLRRFGSAAGEFEKILAGQPSPQLKGYLDGSLPLAVQHYKTAEAQAAGEWEKVEAELADLPADDRWAKRAEAADKFLLKNPEYPEALLARAEALVNLDRRPEARRDFMTVFNNPLASAGHDRALTGLLNDELLSRPEEAAGDLPPLERKDFADLEGTLSLMLEKERQSDLLLLRGRVRLLLGGEYQASARDDFQAARDVPELTEEQRAHITGGLGELPADTQDEVSPGQENAGASSAPDWDEVQARERSLRADNRLAELEAFYTRLTALYPDYAYGYSARAYLRLEGGRAAEARDDFIKAVELERDAQVKLSHRKMIARIDAGLTSIPPQPGAADQEPAPAVASQAPSTADRAPAPPAADRSPATSSDDWGRARVSYQPPFVPLEHYLSQAQEAQQRKDEALLRSLMARIDSQPLDSFQSGWRDYIWGEYHWGREELDEAFALFTSAAEKLPEGFFLSDSYARISNYYLRRGDNQAALEYIDKSLTMTPDFSWHNIQAGNVQRALKNNATAIDYYLRAESDESLTLADRYYYNALAFAYLGLGDRPNFDNYMRRHIDSETARLDQIEIATDDDLRRLHDSKKTYSDLSKQYGGHIFIFGNRYENGDYISNISGEVKKLIPLDDYRAELYAVAGGTMGSSFSGSYYNPWAGREMRWVGKSRFGDDAYAGLGARFFPFSSSGFNIGLEQIFGLGNDSDEDTRLYLNIYEAVGNNWEPLKDDWTYASLYGRLNYSISDDDLTFGGEGRLGRRFNLDCFDRLVAITPFVGVSTDYGGKQISKGSRWGLEAGPGLIFTKWLAEDDPYKVPTSNIEFAIQYRFGLSHERENLISGTMYFDF